MRAVERLVRASYISHGTLPTIRSLQNMNRLELDVQGSACSDSQQPYNLGASLAPPKCDNMSANRLVEERSLVLVSL